MKKIEYIIAAIDKIKGTFIVDDIAALMPKEYATIKNVSSELIRMAEKKVIAIEGKRGNKNVYVVPKGTKAADEYRKYASAPRVKGENSRSFMLEHPIIQFPLGNVRMVASKERYFAA